MEKLLCWIISENMIGLDGANCTAPARANWGEPAMWPSRQKRGSSATADALEVARGARRGGGAFATIVSAFALIFSGFSFYESVLKSPRLSVYVPPQIAYTDPDRPDSPFEVFILPVTLANDGARTGTVLAIELKVTNPRTSQSKRFYASHFGPWSSSPPRPFAPISLAGKAAFSEAIQFYPRVGEKNCADYGS